MKRKVILLDIDGVMEITPGWKRPELLSDGFLKFNERAARNLAHIVNSTSADIILTTTHRKNYLAGEWKTIFKDRGIEVNTIQTIEEFDSYRHSATRAGEIDQWIKEYGNEHDYVIIDDDTSLDNLPTAYKSKWVKTMSLMGLDDDAAKKALDILNGYVV